MPPQPRPEQFRQRPDGRSPIGEVHLLVYDWERGKVEVSVRFPDDALPGSPHAAANQARFRELVVEQLDDAIRDLGRPPD